MKCPKCNRENPDYAKFCGKCGTELLSRKVVSCSHCGALVLLNSKFCSECGQQIIRDSAAVPQFLQDEDFNEISSTNIMSFAEKNPLNDLVPLVQFNPQSKINGFLKFLLLIILFALVLISIVFIVTYFVLVLGGEPWNDPLGPFIVGIILLIIVILKASSIKRKMFTKQCIIQELSDYDYIQNIKKWSNNNRYIFVAKDKKIGLFDMSKMTISVPADYDKLEWRRNPYELNATRRGQNFIIDVNNKTL